MRVRNGLETAVVCDLMPSSNPVAVSLIISHQTHYHFSSLAQKTNQHGAESANEEGVHQVDHAHRGPEEEDQTGKQEEGES